jgi:CRISPR system Cascade subunit CasE
MYLSRVRIEKDQPDFEKIANLIGDAYSTHRFLWQLFPDSSPNAKRDFLYRQDQDSDGWHIFYVLSERKPQPIPKVFSVISKEYDPVLHEGDRLFFSLRANPTITRKISEKKYQHHDVVMDAKRQIKQDKAHSVYLPKIVREIGYQWLSAQAERHGFAIQPENVIADGYFQHRIYKPENKPIRFSTVDFIGRLVVTEPDEFKKVLYAGLGRAKSFGCGLMLIRRA